MSRTSQMSLKELKTAIDEINRLHIGKSGGRKVSIQGKEHLLNQVVLVIKHSRERYRRFCNSNNSC